MDNTTMPIIFSEGLAHGQAERISELEARVDSMELMLASLRGENRSMRDMMSGAISALTQASPPRPAQKVSRTAAPLKRTEYPEDFEEFWNAYPRRDKKKDAYKAWIQTSEIRPPQKDLMESVKHYSGLGLDRKYTALPASWLRGERWEDDRDQDAGGVNAANMTDIWYLIDRDNESNHPRWEEYDRLYRAGKQVPRFEEWLNG